MRNIPHKPKEIVPLHSVPVHWILYKCCHRGGLEVHFSANTVTLKTENLQPQPKLSPRPWDLFSISLKRGPKSLPHHPGTPPAPSQRFLVFQRCGDIYPQGSEIPRHFSPQSLPAGSLRDKSPGLVYNAQKTP